MSTRPRRTTAAGGRPVLRVIAGAGRGRSGLLPLAALVIVAVFAVVALQAHLAQVGFRTARLERQVAQAEDRYALLRGEVAQLSSPDRVASAATELGMVAPPDPVFLQSPRSLPESDATEGEDTDFASKRLVRGGP